MNEDKYPTDQSIDDADTTDLKVGEQAKMFVMMSDVMKVLNERLDAVVKDNKDQQKAIAELWNKMARYEGVEQSLKRALGDAGMEYRLKSNVELVEDDEGEEMELDISELEARIAADPRTEEITNKIAEDLLADKRRQENEG